MLTGLVQCHSQCTPPCSWIFPPVGLSVRSKLISTFLSTTSRFYFYTHPVLIGVDKRIAIASSRHEAFIVANSLNCLTVIHVFVANIYVVRLTVFWSKLSTSHVPAAAQCVMASGEHGSGRFGGESRSKSDVWKYFNKSADGKKAECKLWWKAANMESCHRILSKQEGWESIFCSAHCLQLCLKGGLTIAARKLVGPLKTALWLERMSNPETASPSLL